jgi:hypothetical protein
MPYPFFECIVCRNRVQKVVDMPVRRKDERFSASFDDDRVFERHCRGQGPKYNHRRGALAFGVEGSDLLDTDHYNFSGFFAGMCCFCARHSGFGTELFVCSGCRNCVRKDIMRSAFARLMCGGGRRRDGAESSSSSWEAHGWRALPDALVDRILSFVVGLQEDQGLVDIRDGGVVTVFLRM